MLDAVFVAMFAVVPLMGLGIYLAKYRKAYTGHKRLQLILGIVLLTTVVAFEIDMRLHGWRQYAEDSPYYTEGEWNPVWYALIVHLAFAIPTVFLWIWVIVQALRKFSKPAKPGAHSKSHIKVARAAAATMLGTAVTGWIFYWMAFMAS